MRSPLLVAALLSALWATAPACADELSEVVDTNEGVYAVQNRLYLKGHEFHVSLGVLPLDALYKGIPVGFGYAYHFNPVLGWQIVHFRYVPTVETATVGELDKLFGVMSSHTPYISYLLDSNVVFKVLAGKMVFGERRLFGAEIAAIVGPALGILSTSQQAWGLDLGLSFRTYLNRYFSATLEVREYELFQPSSSKVNNVLDISLGASLNLR